MSAVSALVRLMENAEAFARTYAALTEALIREGVPEDRAREDARLTAYLATLAGDIEDYDDEEPWDL